MLEKLRRMDFDKIIDLALKNKTPDVAKEQQPDTGGHPMAQAQEQERVAGEITKVSTKNFSIEVNDKWYKTSKDNPMSEFQVGEFIEFTTRSSTREYEGKTYETFWVNNPKWDAKTISERKDTAPATEASAAPSRDKFDSMTDNVILYGQVLNAIMAKTLDAGKIKKGIETLFPEIRKHRAAYLPEQLKSPAVEKVEEEPPVNEDSDWGNDNDDSDIPF